MKSEQVCSTGTPYCLKYGLLFERNTISRCREIRMFICNKYQLRFVIEEGQFQVFEIEDGSTGPPLLPLRPCQEPGGEEDALWGGREGQGADGHHRSQAGGDL